MSAASAPTRASRVVAVNAILLTALLHVLRFGYDFGTSDQDEFVPAALRALDPALFASDWLVSWQSAGFSVRTPIILILSALGSILSVQRATLFLYVASFCLIAYAAVRLVRLVTTSTTAVLIAPVLMLVATPRFTLGGNDLTHTLFVPSMLAWGLALHGVVMMVQRRHIAGGFLFGLGTIIQPLVGIQTAGLSALALVVAAATSSTARSTLAANVRGLLLTGVVAIAVASPVLASIILTQMGGTGSVSAAREFDLLVHIRAPHHFLPSAFPTESFLRFGVLALAGASAALLAPVLRPLRGFLVSLYSLTGLACAAYFVGVEYLEWLPVAKMQLMKSTVLIKVFACVAVGASVGARLDAKGGSEGTRPGLLERLATSNGTALGLLALLATTVAAAPFVPALTQRFGLFDRKGSAWEALHTWARYDTHVDDLFAVPPSNADMRSWSRRAIASNFKAFAFQADAMSEWNSRLVAFSNNADIATRFVSGHELDASYETMDTSDLVGLADVYGVDYFVRRTRIVASDSASAVRISLARTFVDTGSSVADSLYLYRAQHQ